MWLEYYPYKSCLLFAISSSSTARDFPFRAAALVAALKRRWSIATLLGKGRRAPCFYWLLLETTIWMKIFFVIMRQLIGQPLSQQKNSTRDTFILTWGAYSQLCLLIFVVR